jgi:hypothetical protein
VISALLAVLLSQGPVDFPVRRYALDPARSSIRFEGTSTLHGFGGRARSVGGEAFADPERPVQTGGARLWVDVGERREDVYAVEIGASSWLRLREPSGDGPFAQLLGALEGLPGELRERLGELRGIPREAELRVVLPDSNRTGWRLRVGEPSQGTIPAWVAARGRSAKPAGSPERSGARNPSGDAR